MLYLLTFFDRAEWMGNLLETTPQVVINTVTIFSHFAARAIKL